MKIGIYVFAVMAAIVGTLSMNSISQAQQASVPHRQVNVTNDSIQGWIPTKELEQKALQTMTSFLSALEKRDYEGAIKIHAPLLSQHGTVEQFVELYKRYWANAGNLIERKVIKVTWTKDSPNAPLPGIYAAIDLALKSTNVDRECGFIILFAPDEKSAFTVMRDEENFIPNAVADQAKSKAELDQLWAKLTVHCPGGTG